MTDLEITEQLTREQARELTDEAKEDAAMLWAKLYALYEGKAHEALGYTDWGEYAAAEFGWSASYGKYLLQAGRVRATLEREATIVALPHNEAVARELTPVLRKAPEQLEEIWHEAVATSEHEAPTAEEVRAVVDRRAPQVRPRSRGPKRKPRLSRDDRRIRDVHEYRDRLRALDRELHSVTTRLQSGKLTSQAFPDELSQWLDLASRIHDQAEALRGLLETTITTRR